MIFSSQLGKLDGQNTEQSIKSISNHVRKMQEELEYRLSVLDSSNISEINTDDTNIFANGENINNIITDQEGNISALRQTVDGITTTVSNQSGDISALQQTADSLTSVVQNQGGDISALQQTATSLTSTVQSINGSVSTLQQTADSLSSTVSTQGTSISRLQQKDNEISASVSNMQSALSTTLRMDASGVYIIDQNGNMVSISGSQIDASTIRVSDLYGQDINLISRVWVDFLSAYHYYTAGKFSVTGSSSTTFAVDLHSYGALRNTADYGDVYLESVRGYVTLAGASGNTCVGNFFPSGQSVYSCGTSSRPWSAVYASTGSVSTSDREKKNSIDYDTERYEKFFDNLKPCSFKMNDGTSDRRHVGMIAQDVEEAMTAVGLTSKDFAGLVKAPKKDEDEKEIEGEYDYFLRYSEFIGICIAEIQKLKARVDELERKAQNDGQTG